MVSLRHILRVYEPCNVTDTCSDVATSEEIWTTLMAVYLGAILLLSLTLNGTICLVFYKKSALLNISNCFVLNLCVCQLALSVLVLPFCLFSVVSRDHEYTGALCSIQGYLLTVSMVTIHMTLMIIALDRNYAIMNSLRYPYVFTQRRCNIMIASSWLVGIVAGIPPLLNIGGFTYQRHQFVCGLDWRSNQVYLSLLSTFCFFLPVLIQTCCYIKIFNAAVGHTRRTKRVHVWVSRPSSVTTDQNDNSCESVEMGESVATGSYQTSGCKAVRTILVIALSYCACWLPYFINAYLHLSMNIYSPNLNATSICFLFATSIANPVIYAYMNRVTRRETARFLCGNTVRVEGEDFVSSSVSAFAFVRQSGSTWTSHHRLRPPRVLGGPIPNDMDTIAEETETNMGSDISVSGGDHVETGSDIESSSAATFDQTFTLNANTLQENVRMKIQKETADGPATHGHDKERVQSRAKMERLSAKTLVGVSRFKERRRTRRAMSDTAGLKHSRRRHRKRRDYGSFLYFKHSENAKNLETPCSHKYKNKQPDSEQFSIDHVQKIKLSTVPKAVNFRVSVTDIDNVNKSITVNSNVEIETHEPGAKTCGSQHEPGAKTSGSQHEPGAKRSGSQHEPEDKYDGHDVYLPAVPLSEEERKFCKTRRSRSID